MAQEKIKNVGPKSAAWLRQVGIRSAEDLQRIGPEQAFLKVKRAGFKPSLNLLYALAGAVDGCHWAELSDERKSGLLAAVETSVAENPILNRWQKAAAASDREARKSDDDAGHDSGRDEDAGSSGSDDAGDDSGSGGESSHE